MNIIEIIAIILLIICLAFIIKPYIFDDYMPLKGSRIILGDDNYPNLFLFLPDKKLGGVGIAIFDKNWRDYVGNTTYDKLKDDLKNPKMYNFDKMSKNDFVKEFGTVLKNNNKDPLKTYFQYRSFAFSQLYKEDLDISKDEFERNYSDDFKELGYNSSDVLDLLLEFKKRHIDASKMNKDEVIKKLNDFIKKSN
jgi:hypothetical protein